LGTILQLTLSVPTACFGPLFGVYIIGFFLPWMNKKATLTASIVAFLSMMFYVFQVQTEMAKGRIKFSTKITSSDGCNESISEISNIFEASKAEERTTSIYQISYLYYTFLGTALVLVLASILTLFWGVEDASKIDRKLLVKPLQKYGRSEKHENVTLSQIK
jgi:solute carrier family 5 (sodium-coupled monocarboxylate transporter), member 8/12